MPFSAALLIVGAVVLLAVAAGVILRAQDGRRRSGGTVRVLAGDLPGGTLTPSVTLVQFSTELCARCPQVRRLLGDIATDRGIGHVEVDLTNRRDLASRYQVLQTPTTFLIDAAGVVLSRWGGVPDRRSIEDVIVAVPHGSMPTIRNQEQS